MVASSKLTDQVKLIRATVARVVNPVELQALGCFSDADCSQVIEQFDLSIPLVSFHPFNYSIDDGLIEKPDSDMPLGESVGVNSRSLGIGSSAPTGNNDGQLGSYHRDSYNSSTINQSSTQLRQKLEKSQQSPQNLAAHTSSPANSPLAIGEATSQAIAANETSNILSELSRLLGEIERLSSNNSLRSSGTGIQIAKAERMPNRSRSDQSTYTNNHDIKSPPQQMEDNVYSTIPIFETIQQLMDSYAMSPTRETVQLNGHSSTLTQLTDHFFSDKKQRGKSKSMMAHPIDSSNTTTLDTLPQAQHDDEPDPQKPLPKLPLRSDNQPRENYSQSDTRRAQRSSTQELDNKELLKAPLFKQTSVTDAINQPLFSRDLAPSETQKLVDALSEYLQEQASLHGVDLR